MKKFLATLFCVLCLCATQNLLAADVVPDFIKQPGTQPMEIGNLESPNKCDNCHGGYNASVEPAHNWLGSMMSHAGRDPIFWATLAIAEQDLDGAGDLCLRCHSTSGWLAGRSSPTDGSGLAPGDSDGVDCDYCHKLTNPDDSEHLGVMNPPFEANGPEGGYYGSGMSSMWGGSDKLGPYNNADARHQFMQSEFHRDRSFCGTCHDVSNPVVGDLAPNRGAQFNSESVVASDDPNSPPGEKAAFNNKPHTYGTVERTFSEFWSGGISATLVDNYPSLPSDLQAGVLQQVYDAATGEGSHSANYQNPPAPRFFSCQSCHMRPVTGKGANKKGVPTRVDLPLHDMTGGNYWMADAIEYLNGEGKLRLGGDMSAYQVQAMKDGALRAREQLELAASLEVDALNDTVRIINHTGHKLITGYPEGRRMWLNIKWYDELGGLMEEYGAYGPLLNETGNPVTVANPAGGPDVQVETILDLDGANTVIYEAHMGITQAWAAELVTAENAGLPLMYDRLDSSVEYTLGELAAGSLGNAVPTFHFALNNTVVSDNRIPPYHMEAAEAERRNAAPVTAHGEPARYTADGGGYYPYYDVIALNRPDGAESATIELLYQPTSWEYIQFLYLANNGESAFLGNEGDYMLEAWLATGMAAPVVMASATVGDTTPPPACELQPPVLDSAVAGHGQVSLAWSGEQYDGFNLYYDQAEKAQLVAELECEYTNCYQYTDSGLTDGNEYCYKVTATSEEPECESAFSSEILCATPQPQGTTEYASVQIEQTGRLVKAGKGKHAELQFEEVDPPVFAQGERIAVKLVIRDESNLAVPGATATLTAAGPETAFFSTAASDTNGRAQGDWKTQAPNRKGAGGTTAGFYTISVSGLDSSTHEWDGTSDFVTIEITN